MTRPFVQWTVLPHGRLVREETVPVDAVAPRFDDPDVPFVTVPGTRGREAARLVRAPKGVTLVLNDVVGNIRDASGIGGWLLRVAGFAGKEAQVPAVVKRAVIDDTQALRTQLSPWAGIDTLVRILVSHGSPIEAHPRQVLRALSESLA
jgi:predicted TIM-barrel enzyme